jgi:hypothetical protein
MRRRTDFILHPVGVISLIVVALGGTPSPVDAQSTAGWVLWEKYSLTKGGAQTTTWEPQDGFDVLADCRLSARQLVQVALDYVKASGGKVLGPAQLEGRAVGFELTEGGVQQRVDVRYLCFPGTLDPRPRP